MPDNALPRFLARALAAIVLAVAVAGCGSVFGGSNPPPPDDFERYRSGEIERVDTARREIVLEAEPGVETRLRGADDRLVIAYDDRTRVVYRGEQYQPGALEAGDLVRVELQYAAGGDLYTPYVEVTDSVQQRTGGDDLAGTLSGKVDDVDDVRREIRIDTAEGDYRVRYDDDTPVVYEGREYRATALEAGDLIRVDTRFDGGERWVVGSIDVLESVQERTGGTPGGGFEAADRLEGRVEWIDERRGEFGVRTDRLGVVTVEVPFDAERIERDRFAGLDEGDYVRLSVEESARGRYRLVSFR
jgi:hypothetical protein